MPYQKVTTDSRAQAVVCEYCRLGSTCDAVRHKCRVINQNIVGQPRTIRHNNDTLYGVRARSDQPKRLLVALNLGSLLPLALALDFRFRLPLLGLFLIFLLIPGD